MQNIFTKILKPWKLKVFTEVKKYLFIKNYQKSKSCILQIILLFSFVVSVTEKHPID